MASASLQGAGRHRPSCAIITSVWCCSAFAGSGDSVEGGSGQGGGPHQHGYRPDRADLRDLGLVSEVGEQRGPARPARDDPSSGAAAHGIGVRLDRNRIETALVDLGGALVARRSHCMPLPHPQRPSRSWSATSPPSSPRRKSWRPGGCSASGWRGLQSRRLARQARSARSRPRPLGRFRFRRGPRAETGLDVHEENDGTAAAIAELFHGFGRESDDFRLCLHRSCNRRRRHPGRRLPAWHLRQCRRSCRRCRCRRPPPLGAKSRGPVEILLTRASVVALIRHLRACGRPVEGMDDLPAAIAACPDAFREWLDDCVEALVGPALSAQALLDVPNIILDGDLSAAVLGEIVDRLRDALASAIPEARTPPRLRIGTFGSSAHALGLRACRCSSISPRGPAWPPMRGRPHRRDGIRPVWPDPAGVRVAPMGRGGGYEASRRAMRTREDPMHRILKAAMAGVALAALAVGAAQAGDIVGLITKTNTNPFFVKMKEAPRPRPRSSAST